MRVGGCAGAGGFGTRFSMLEAGLTGCLLVYAWCVPSVSPTCPRCPWPVSEQYLAKHPHHYVDSRTGFSQAPCLSALSCCLMLNLNQPIAHQAHIIKLRQEYQPTSVPRRNHLHSSNHSSRELSTLLTQTTSTLGTPAALLLVLLAANIQPPPNRRAL